MFVQAIPGAVGTGMMTFAIDAVAKDITDN
jgi:hypothetical protein